MTDQVTAAPEVKETPEQAVAAEEAAFNKGYGQAKGIEPDSKEAPHKVELTEVKSEATLEKKVDPATPAQAVPEKQPEMPKVFGMTEAELKAELAKSGSVDAKVTEEIRKVYGKIGEITRSVQELGKNLSAGKASRKITAEALKRVNEELPGLGAALAQDLSDILGGAEAAQVAAQTKGETFDPEKYHAEKLAPALDAIEARIALVQEEAQHELLSYMHSDYEEFLKSEPFKSWLQTLPADRREFVVKSPRAVVAGSAITEAKKWVADRQKSDTKDKDRLERAIQPKGSDATPAPQVLDEEAAFRKGYKKAAGR